MLNKKLFTKTPLLAQWLYPTLLWRYKPTQKKIYLTFDDGPTPKITDAVLAILKSYNAKATFFCVGQQAEKNKDLLQKIIAENHTIGNHTNKHLNGWQTNTKTYLNDIADATSTINSKLFRPPYGKIKRKQIATISKQYKIVMWDVLSYDYDKNISPEKCLQFVLKSTRSGSIVVFHDSVKSEKNMLYALPKMLEHFSKLGYSFCAIE